MGGSKGARKENGEMELKREEKKERRIKGREKMKKEKGGGRFSSKDFVKGLVCLDLVFQFV